MYLSPNFQKRQIKWKKELHGFVKNLFLIYKILMKYSLLFLLFSPVFLSAETVERTMVTVEGEMISLIDLKETRKRLKQGLLEESILLPLFNKSQLQTKDSVLLDFLIYEKLLDISAAQTSFQIDEKTLKQELNKKRRRKDLSKKAFSRLLVKNHFTSSSYREFLRKSILRKLFIQKEIAEKIRISDQDLNEYALRKQGEELFTSFEYELAYLFFPHTKKGEKQAQKIFRRISKDSSLFEKWTPSQKEEKKEILKKLQLSTMHPSIKTAIKKLSVGQISSVLSLPTGYHIFKVLWKTPIITGKNKKIKEQLTSLLFKELFKKQLKLYLEEQKKKSFIQTNS